MSSYDDEQDPLSLSRGHSPSISHVNHHQPPLQNLLFPRNRSQIFTPLTPPRQNSFRSPTRVRRSQALLDRSRTPAQAWEKYRKSAEEIKAIKSRKVRQFYENQVCSLTV